MTYVVMWNEPYGMDSEDPTRTITYSATTTRTAGPQSITVAHGLAGDRGNVGAAIRMTPTVTEGGSLTTTLTASDDSTAILTDLPEEPPIGATPENVASTDEYVPSYEIFTASISEPTKAPSTNLSSTDATSSEASAATSLAALRTGTTTADSDGISLGAAASVGVVCAIVGAIIAGLVALLLYRRRGRRIRHVNIPQDSSLDMHGYSFSSAKSTGTSVICLSQRDSVLQLDQQLPPPQDFNELAIQMQGIYARISDHAHRFFSNGEPSTPKPHPNDSDLAFKISQLLHPDPSIDPGHLAMLLLKPTSRPAAIRFILAWSILKNIELNSPPLTTLLPPELSECLQAMSHTGDQDSTRYELKNEWRRLTSILLSPTYARTHLPPRDPRQHNLSFLLHALDELLHLFITQNIDSEAQQRKNELRALLEEGALLGWSLFSQPGRWDFDWGGEAFSVQEEIFVVWPGLLMGGRCVGRIERVGLDA